MSTFLLQVQISSFSPVFENKVNTLVSSFSDRLLPAIKDGKQVESVFYVQVHVNYKNDVQTKTHLDKPYLNEVFLSYRKTNNSSNAVVTNFFSMPGKLDLENPNKLEVLK